MRPAPYKLRTRLLMLVLFAVIPAIGVMAYNAIFQRHQAVRQVQNETLNLAQLTAHKGNELIATTRLLLKGLSGLPEIHPRRRPRACDRILADLLKLHPYYGNLGVATPAGLVYCSGVPLKQAVDISDRSYFRRAIDTRDFAVGSYQVGRITGSGSINFGYPLLDNAGQVRAVVFAALRLTWLDELIGGIHLPPGSTVTMLDRNGTILVRRPDPQRWAGKSLPKATFIQAMQSLKNHEVIESAELDGIERLYSFAGTDEGSAENTYVRIGIPRDAILAPVNQRFVRALILLIGVTLLTFAGAWLGGNRIILRQLKALTNAAERLARGDLTARTGLSHGAEEFGQLARTFDEMAGSMEKNSHEITQTQSELKRVNRILKALSAGNHAVLRAVSEDALLHDMCRAIVQWGGYQFAWVGFAEHDRDKTVRPVAQAGYEDGYLAQLNVTWADTERGRGPAGTAIRTGKPCFIRNISTDPAFAPWREEARKRGYASCMALPLFVSADLIGVLCIYAKEAHAFDQEEVGLLTEMAGDLSYGIETLRTRQANEQANKTILRMAYYDALTDLPNHTHFEERLKEALHQAERHHQPLAVLLVDMDGFREVNNSLGFQQGDILLKEVARRQRRELQGEGMVARMRGDEFAILLPKADAESAAVCAQRINLAMSEPFVLDGLRIDMRASVGIVIFPDHGADVEELMRKVDVAMSKAKETGGGFVIYSSEQDENRSRRLTLAGDLRRAIENGELQLYFQPKIDIATRRTCGVEALARWHHPEHGMISPTEFIALAEHTGLIRPLTNWVLQSAMRQSHVWRQAGIDIPIAANLSARNLREVMLLEQIKEFSRQWRIEPGMLELEITESTIMDDPAGALDILRQLHDLGIPIFIDDFGTGYSSLSYLQKLPVDSLKIDKSFVIDMLGSKDAATIVRSTITLAHDLGLKVVAEGVENQAQLDQLTALGCDVAQGFYIGKPMPEAAFREWLATSRRIPSKKSRAG